ncbi:zinc finger protein 331-like [Apis florea]|uniref:zinc finger protein 331-like n=1 Tax=Apis florea TaxID=7463 RepID=UPI0012FE8527|nr:zinc finger protein 331-like [Apis florea]
MIRRDNKGNYALYQCGMCGKSYSWKSSYHRHLREECGKQQRAKCKNCGRQYRWRDSLNKHLKYECGVEPKYTYSKRDHNRVNYDAPFTCYKCGKRYTWTDSLTRHLREGCGKLPRHKCTLCAYCGSDYYKRLGRHFCSNCGKEYRWMQSLIRHEKEECGKDPQHSCPVCGTKIRHKWMLKKHLINVHHWVIPNGKNFYLGSTDGRLPKQFVCDKCGKTYKWRESLQQHRRLECGIEPRFACIFCGRRFKHKHHLKEHLKRRHHCDQLKTSWLNE